MPPWVSFSLLLGMFKDINVRLFGDSELAVVGVNGCLFLCAGPVMDH